MEKPRLIQTYLLDGTMEGARVIEVSESSIKALVVPRIRLSQVKDRPEANQPSLYFLLNSGDNQIYIGESENFYSRIKNHDQGKDFWDIAVAVVSTTNNLEKSDVKYLESLAVEKAKATSASGILNKTIPARNNIHEFKIHSLEKDLKDAALIIETLGFNVFASSKESKQDVWHCITKKTNAIAEFRGDKFVLLAGSIIDKTYAPSWAKAFPKSLVEREEILKLNGKDLGDSFELTNNVPTRSPNHAGGIVSGRSINAWVSWKNSEGKTMDEVMRKGSA